MKESLPIEFTVLKVLECQVFGVLVGKSLYGDHTSDLYFRIFRTHSIRICNFIDVFLLVRFVLQTLMTMNSNDLTKTQVFLTFLHCFNFDL